MKHSKKPLDFHETTHLSPQEQRETSPLSVLNQVFPYICWPSEYWFYDVAQFMEPAYSFDLLRNEP